MPCRITPYQQRMIRIAREEEERRRDAQERRRIQDQREAKRVAAIDREWSAFKTGVDQVRREQMRRAFFQHFDGVLNEVSNYFNPPPPAPSPTPVPTPAPLATSPAVKSTASPFG